MEYFDSFDLGEIDRKGSCSSPHSRTPPKVMTLLDRVYEPYMRRDSSNHIDLIRCSLIGDDENFTLEI